MTAKETRIVGPPGCGKTTTLSRMILGSVKTVGSEGVLVASYAKAAAVELAGRNLPIDASQVGTLHALSYRALGSPEIAEKKISEWNAEFPQFAMSASGSGKDEPSWDLSSKTEGDALMAAYQTQRAKMIPIEEMQYEGITFGAEGDPFTEFVSAWNEWKRACDYFDFGDMIERAYYELDGPPGSPSIMFLDEAQDLAPIELALARKWAQSLDRLIIAGDDDQCQPPNTLVLTPNGEKRIIDLDPITDLVVSMSRSESEMRRTGYRFNKSVRLYNGRMYTVSADGKSTRTTRDHKWLVRWNERARTTAHVVYLMRRGDDFRVGWCKLIRADGVFHLGDRAHKEKADQAWVLHVSDDRTEASIVESYISAKYGLPLATFEPVNGASHYTRESLDSLFAMFSDGELLAHASACLRELGQDIQFPIWEQAGVQRGGAALFLTRSVNLIDGLMKVPVPDGKRVRWVDISVAQQWYTGDVVSLDVETSPYYVADGIITHNSIMTFRGASPESIFGGDPSTFEQEILSQSYRVPRAVLEKADAWIRQLSWRVEKSYQPRKEIVGFDAYDQPVYGDTVAEGFVKTLWQADYGEPGEAIKIAQDLIGQGKTVMFLATCSYMLRETCAALREAGVPYANPYAKRRADWNPLDMGSRTRKTAAYRVARYLAIRDDFEPDGARVWDAEEFAAWATCIRTDDLFKRGVKTRLNDKEFSLPSHPGERLGAIGDLLRAEASEVAADEHFANAIAGDLGWLRRRLSGDMGKRMHYPLRIAETLGPKALLDPPRAVVGTAHSVKGGQSDVVFLIPDISRAGAEEWASPGERQDSVRRLMYVALTRAREGVYLMGQATGNYVKGLW